MTPFPGTDTIIELTYLIATALFILSLKWMSSPTTARHGVWAGELGMLLAIVGTLLNRSIVDYKWVAIALVLGTIIGVPLGKVQMTAVPQRTALSHAFGALLRHAGRHGGILFARARCAQVHDVRAVDGSDSRLAHVYRQLDGRRKAAGNSAAAPHHLQGSEHRQPWHAPRCHWRGRFSGDSSGSHVLVSRASSRSRCCSA